MNDETDPHAKPRSRRWEEGVTRLAMERGDSPAVAQRAIALTRQMNIAPWVALAVAERLVDLKDAWLLDRAGRCKELPAAVLDRKLSLEQLRVTLPYAPHFLAVELQPLLRDKDWSQRELTGVVGQLLKAEAQRNEDGEVLPVRTRTLAEYAAVVERMNQLMRETRCGMAMAMDVALGRLAESLVRQNLAHRRRLVQESREQMMESPRRPFPGRRGDIPGGRARQGGVRPSGFGGGFRHGGPSRRQFDGGSRAGTPRS